MQRVGEDILAALDAAAAAPVPPRIGEVLGEGGASAFGFTLVVLCLPFLQPISLGPLSTIGGLALAGIGWQLARGDARPWLPEKLSQAPLDAKQWGQLATAARKVLGWAGKLVRPRLGHWTEGRRGHRIAGSLVIVAALLLAIPVAGIPFNNLLPALAIVCAALALMADDGLMFLFAVFWLLVTIGYFIVLYEVFVAMATKAWAVLQMAPTLWALVEAGWRVVAG
ncbi:MAG: exopolysaccharide biosynthesis protein [Silanimonas sp.]